MNQSSPDRNLPSTVPFAVSAAPNSAGVPLRAAVMDVLSALAPLVAAQSVQTEVNVPEELALETDESLLRPAIATLMASSVATMPSGGQLVVTAVCGPAGVELEIADSGSVLPAGWRQSDGHALSVDQRTMAGVGSSAVARFLARHDGHVTARNCPEGGTAVTLCLPRYFARKAA